MSPLGTVGRLHGKKEFVRALRARRVENGLLVARAWRREPDHPPELRLGVVLSRRLAKAVRRNLLRRRLREACRKAAGARGRWDMVLLPRGACLDASYDEICSSVGDILRRLGICAR